MVYKFKEYIETPTDSLNITSNTTYNVVDKARVIVNVPNPSVGSVRVNTNTTTDVTDYASVITNIPQGVPIDITSDAEMTAVLVDYNEGKLIDF